MNKTGFPYIEKDGFKFFTGYEPFEMFLMESGRIEECVEYCKRNNIENIMLSHVYGFTGESIYFLNDLYIKRLAIRNSDIKDIGILNGQKDLLSLILVMQYDMQEIDFNNFPELNRFSGDWSPDLKNLFLSKKMKELWLWKYKSKSRNADEFGNLKSIEELYIIQSNLKNLNGLEKLKNLKILGLYYNLNLEDFYDLKSSQSSRLSKLIIEFCKRLDLSQLQYFKQLVHLEIINNGKVDSLEIINKLPELEFLQFTEGEMIESNNTYMIKHPKLKEVVLSDKKHYLLKESDINLALSDPKYKTQLLKK